MTLPQDWKDHIQKNEKTSHLYPTEWVVRTLAGGNYPRMHIDKSTYGNANILDVSCGDGRNIGLLQNLGFTVYATEISPEIVEQLESKKPLMNWNAEFACAKNGELPYSNEFFSFILACHSCYYLDEETSFDDALREFSRCIKPGGSFIASIPDYDNYLFKGSIPVDEDTVIVTQDPYGLRINQRMAFAKNESHLQSLLAKHFEHISIGHIADDYFGTRVSAYLFVCRKPYPSSK